MNIGRGFGPVGLELNLIQKCWKQDPDKRFTFEEIHMYIYTKRIWNENYS